MTLLEYIRNKAFKLFDSSGEISAHIAEIKMILEGNQPEKNKKINDKILQDLLHHALTTTPFYQKLNVDSLDQFPIINKSIIRESFQLFLSNQFLDKELLLVVTSGSTGTPFKTFQNKAKKIRNYADTSYFASIAGFQIGHRLIYMKIWAKEKMTSPFEYWIRNIVPIDVISLNDHQIDGIVKKMESNSSTYGILGYASTLELLCRYLDKMNKMPKTKVLSIISMSESLNEYTKTTLQKHFNTPVVARYSNLENGIIAQQETNGKSRYLVNSASYFVEILKMEEDVPAEMGELGRIVVTDLYNYAMPLIRYDTGDIGAYELDNERPGLMFLSTVEGRKLDQLFDTQGNLVSSYIMYKNMWKYTEINQYQLIQEDQKRYVFKINVEGEFLKEEQLINEFKKHLGFDANFKIQYVDEIPLLSSGKRRTVVNNYKPTK